MAGVGGQLARNEVTGDDALASTAVDNEIHHLVVGEDLYRAGTNLALQSGGRRQL